MEIKLRSLSTKIETGCVSALAFSPSGKFLVTAHQYGQVNCWNFGRGEHENGFIIPRREFDKIQFIEEHKCFLSGPSCLYEYQIFTPEFRSQFWRTPKGSLTRISPDGKVVASAQCYDSWLALEAEEPFLILQKYDRDEQLKVFCLEDIGRNIFFINPEEMAFSPDGKSIAFVIELHEEEMDREYRLYFLSVEEPEYLTSFYETPFRISPVCSSPKGHYFAFGSLEDNSITILKIENEIKSYDYFYEHKEPIKALAFNHEERILASGGEDGRLCLWDLETKSLISSYQHLHPVTSLIFHPGENTLVLGDETGGVYIGKLE